MIRPTIGIDWDDVTAPFNSIAIKMANEHHLTDTPLVLEDITSWENTGRASVIKQFYGCEELYHRQRQWINPDNVEVINSLMEVADVYFITAAYPDFMSIRARHIMEVFPELPEGRIILGAAKSLVQFDIILDDNVGNVLDSPAQYPVLFRKPWNKNMTGVLSVNSMKEFKVLVEHILESGVRRPKSIDVPAVLALVGPSGSGKREITNYLVQNYPEKFRRVTSYTTNPVSGLYTKSVTEEEFKQSDFFETTSYAGHLYGTKFDEIKEGFETDKFTIIPLDMCGSIGMKRHFRTYILYIDKNKEKLIRDVIMDKTMTDTEKTLRILSIPAEKKNKSLCDYVIDNNDNNGIYRILELVGMVTKEE